MFKRIISWWNGYSWQDTWWQSLLRIWLETILFITRIIIYGLPLWLFLYGALWLLVGCP